MLKISRSVASVLLAGTLLFSTLPANALDGRGLSSHDSMFLSEMQKHLIDDSNATAIFNSIKTDDSGKQYFDVEHGVENGVPRVLAEELSGNIERAHNMSVREKESLFVVSAHASGLSHDQWGCLLALAKAVGINLSSLVGVFMTGGWGAVLLIAGVAMANAEAIHACYRDGKPIL